MLVCLTRSSSQSICFAHFYAFETDYNVKQEPEPESRSSTDICTELRDAFEGYVGSQTAKIDTDPGPSVLVEPEVPP